MKPLRQILEGEVIPFRRKQDKPTFGPATKIRFKQVGMAESSPTRLKYPEAHKRIINLRKGAYSSHVHEIHADDKHVGWIVSAHYKGPKSEHTVDKAFDLEGRDIPFERIPLK